MYPIEIKETKYELSILEIIVEIVKVVFSGIKSFRSPKTLMIFLEKSFHF